MLPFASSALLGTVALLVPGLLVARLVDTSIEGEGEDPIRHVKKAAVALGWSFGMIPTFAFFLHLFSPLQVGLPGILLTSLVSSAVTVALLLKRHRLGGPLRRTLSPSSLIAALRACWPVLAASGGVGLVFLFRYDMGYPPVLSCIHESALIAAGFKGEGIDLLRESIDDARLGNTGVIAGFLGVYGIPGLRILYAFCGVMLALGGFILGHRLGGRAAAWGLLFVLPLNPYIMMIPRLDENLLTLSFVSALLPFLAAARGNWYLAGAFFGLIVAMRHVMLPAIGALLLFAWMGPTRRRTIVTFLVAFVIVTFPENLHHHLALGSVFTFESNMQFPPERYSFAGVEFTFRGIMNWPLHSHLVRTPHNPYPMLLGWPLHLAGHLGLVLFGLALIGFFALWRRDRRQWWLWAAWSLPVAGGIALQEHWDYINKMGVLAIVFTSMAAWMVAGAGLIRERPRLGGLSLVAAMLAVSLGAYAVRDWRAPVDTRYFGVVPWATEEDPLRVDARAREMTSLALFPGYERLAYQSPLFERRKIRGMLQELANPFEVLWYPPMWLVNEAPPRGGHVVIEIDLSRRPDDRVDFIRRSTEPPHATVREGEIAWVEDVRVPWDERSLTVLGGVGPEISSIMIFYDSHPESPVRLASASTPEQDHVRQGILEVMKGKPFVPGFERARNPHLVIEPSPAAHSRHHGDVLRLAVPSGGLSLVLMKNLAVGRALFWRIEISPDDVTVHRPFMPWQN